jgi:hypothetical protein
MIQIFQEAVLPKLSQTSLYSKYDQSSGITDAVKAEFSTIKDHMVQSSDVQELVALMKLNGDPIIKKAIAAWDKGDVVVIFNPTSKIPSVLPYIIAGKDQPRCYVFADRLMSKLNNQIEYVNLMAGIEAGYIALCMQKNPNKFINNRDLMLAWCNVYQAMTVAPMEQRLYMKGDNLVKAMLYAIAYFYKMIDGDRMSAERINYKRLLNQKVDPKLFQQIVEEVKGLDNNGFFTFLNLIKKINVVRYKNLENLYLNYFVASCGVYEIFALENPQYLMLLITSANYKTKLSNYGLNRMLSMPCKKIITLMTGMV